MTISLIHAAGKTEENGNDARPAHLPETRNRSDLDTQLHDAIGEISVTGNRSFPARQQWRPEQSAPPYYDPRASSSLELPDTGIRGMSILSMEFQGVVPRDASVLSTCPWSSSRWVDAPVLPCVYTRFPRCHERPPRTPTDGERSKNNTTSFYCASYFKREARSPDVSSAEKLSSASETVLVFSSLPLRRVLHNPLLHAWL